MLDLSYPTLYLVNVEVCISGEVLTDRRLGIAQSTVKGGAPHTDKNSNQAKQEEKQAGVATADIYRERDTESYRDKYTGLMCAGNLLEFVNFFKHSHNGLPQLV